MPELTARNIAFMLLVAAAVAAVLGAVVLLARQDDNAPVRVIAPQSGASGQAAPFPPSAPPLTDVRVYVNGAVVRPGVYTLPPDSRIADALTAAGGPAEDANLDGINLALRVVDQTEYYIAKIGEAPPPIANLPPAQTQGQTGGLIDLNLASAALLDTLPGIGPALAAAIISYRENIRPFQSVAEVQEVPKIGPVTYQNIRDLVTVSGLR
ncbi:MAG: ComEA family DNA-binding protein [Chloroflexi bacterium]|nr:ComEA family DNA-binding protein [Chloroflexota bacterium]MDA1270182.1 ComEA family DNA-binding protein [Chloroflexota bacterium]PKB58781.1 MAG: hypothetical protein BZY83_05225 [SAR202 cluster bacterium Casp-Chloro-G2]